MTFYGIMMESLATLAVVGVPLALVVLGLVATAPGRAWVRGWVGRAASVARAALFVAWLIAAAGTAGSLYLSEVVGFKPCLLCWYQRIALYPLAVVLGVAALDRRVRGIWRAALPLAVIGLGIALYHTVIQLQPSMAATLPCSADAPCTSRYVAVFGFVSIPVLAGSAFLMIAAALGVYAVVEGGDGVDGGVGEER